MSGTDRMILLSLTDRPLARVHSSILPNIDRLARDGLIVRTATGYKITAKGRAALSWDGAANAARQ